jgi:hypothetical protein
LRESERCGVSGGVVVENILRRKKVLVKKKQFGKEN